MSQRPSHRHIESKDFIVTAVGTVGTPHPQGVRSVPVGNVNNVQSGAQAFE